MQFLRLGIDTGKSYRSRFLCNNSTARGVVWRLPVWVGVGMSFVERVWVEGAMRRGCSAGNSGVERSCIGGNQKMISRLWVEFGLILYLKKDCFM